MDACYLPSLSCALALFGVEVFTLRQWFFRVSCKWVRNVKLSPNPCPETLAWPSFQMMGGTRWGLQGLEELPIPGEYRFRKGEREVLGFIKKVELLVRRLIDWTENETNSLDSLTELIPSQRDYVWAGSSTFGKSEQKGPRGTFPFWLEFFSLKIHGWEVAGHTPQSVSGCLELLFMVSRGRRHRQKLAFQPPPGLKQVGMFSYKCLLDKLDLRLKWSQLKDIYFCTILYHFCLPGKICGRWASDCWQRMISQSAYMPSKEKWRLLN